MNYSFDVDNAIRYGVDESIMIHNFKYWIIKNKASGKHFHKGKTWTYNTAAAFSKLFPFWSEKSIRRILDSLISQKVLIKDNFNENLYDRTSWYAFQNEDYHLPKWEDGTSQTVRPIPDSKPDSKTEEDFFPEVPVVTSLTCPPKKKKAVKLSFTPNPPEYPDSLNTPDFLTAWEKYVKYRSASRLKTLTKMSVEAKFNEMTQWGVEAAIEALSLTILNGWNGVFEPKGKNSKRSEGKLSNYDGAGQL